MRVKELMTEDVATVSPATSLKDVAALLVERGISGVPVVDEHHCVLGVVSEADILLKEHGSASPRGRAFDSVLAGRVVDDDRPAAHVAGDAMTAPAITITTGSDVSLAARLMTDRGVKRLPVVNAAGVIVGIVTRSDLVRAFARTDDELAEQIELDIRQLWLEQPERVHLDVQEGEVVVSGRVLRRSDAELLGRFIGRVPGVVGVHSTVSWEWDDRTARV